MMNDLRVALGQIQSSTDKCANLQQITQMTVRAHKAGTKILVFPEAAQVSFAADLKVESEPRDGAFTREIKALAKKYDMIIVAGMFEATNSQKVCNTLIIASPDREDYYRKLHLFDAFGAKESDFVKAGDQYICVPTPYGMLGVATCFDVRFPEQFQALAKQGAEMIAVCASWADGAGKAEQWDLLARARAADSQCWLLACDQAWQRSQVAAALGVGRSAIIDPTGSVRARLSSTPDLLVQDINLKMVANIRAKIPIL